MSSSNCRRGPFAHADFLAASPSDRETRPSKHRVVVGSLLWDRLPSIPVFDDLAVFHGSIFSLPRIVKCKLAFILQR
jgi:hypothetical protein